MVVGRVQPLCVVEVDGWHPYKIHFKFEKGKNVVCSYYHNDPTNQKPLLIQLLIFLWIAAFHPRTTCCTSLLYFHLLTKL